MDVEIISQVFCAHGGTFKMPARESFAPGRRPVHDVFRLRLFPEGKVGRVMLFILALQRTGIRQQVIQYATREFPVFVCFALFFHIEIYRSVFNIGITGIQDLVNQPDLLNHMAGGPGFNAGALHAE